MRTSDLPYSELNNNAMALVGTQMVNNKQVDYSVSQFESSVDIVEGRIVGF